MRPLLAALLVLLGGPALSAGCSPDAVPAPLYSKGAAGAARNQRLVVPGAFERERGVSWDGQIRWRTEARVWVFAAALEASLRGIVRADSPYRLRVTVVRVEAQTGTFVVEFAIQDPSGESLELAEVEGTGPRQRVMDEVYPAVAGAIVTTFKKNLLQ
jgi:hypothetical protein